MESNLKKYSVLAAKALITLAFVAAGLAKLASVDMMVASFEALGVGQWFRYVTGSIEIGAAILLWLPGRQFIGAGLLTATMIGATLAHIMILGTDTMLPAIVLGILSAFIAYNHRDQMKPT